MITKKRVIIISIIILGIISIASLANSFVQASRTATISTIPTALITSKGVLLECNPSILFPGSVNPNSTGFLRVKCPTLGYIQLGINGNISLTPTFTLPLGYLNVSIIVSQSAGSPCNYNFKPLMTGNVTYPSGAIITSGTPITFSSPVIQGQMTAGLYDYCIQYDSSKSSSTTQIPNFSISWT